MYYQIHTNNLVYHVGETLLQALIFTSAITKKKTVSD